jgi:hypothetical protein
VAEIASGGPARVNTLVGALGSIVAIALGVLCGVVLATIRPTMNGATWPSAAR